MSVAAVTLLTCLLLTGQSTSGQSGLQVRRGQEVSESVGAEEGSGFEPGPAALQTSDTNTDTAMNNTQLNQPTESAAGSDACPPVQFGSLLNCPTRDWCQTDTDCCGGLLCCPGACGRRCRCPRAVCSQGCGADGRCVWRRDCVRGRCSPRAVCVHDPKAVCSPPCGFGFVCRRRRPWSTAAAIVTCVPLDIGELFAHAFEHVKSDDCYESDDDDDLFDDHAVAPGKRWGAKPADKRPSPVGKQTGSYPDHFGKSVYTSRDDDDDHFKDDELFGFDE